MKPTIIHQFTSSVSFGDGITNGVFMTQKILRELGFISEIYSTEIEPSFKDKVYHIGSYKFLKDNYLLYHYAIGHPLHDLIMQFFDKKILVYHNITPKHFFPNIEYIIEGIDLGRKQLKESSSSFIASYADSKYNAEELSYYNYKNPQVIPLLIDEGKNRNIKPNEKILKKFENRYTILFVGRVVSNKCQHQLIDTLYFLKKSGEKNIQLNIVGGISDINYLKYLKEKVVNLELEDEVFFSNKVSDDDLVAYYLSADIYLSLSEHEGFSMPLVEAMYYDIPVISFNAGAISSTASKEGLIEKKSPDFVAKEIISIKNNPQKRDLIINSQREHLKEFKYNNLKLKFQSFLERLNITIPNRFIPPIEKKEKINIQIEGPFDSSYSLAIVNRQLARNLSDEFNVKLHSTEGYGDFEPNRDFLEKNSDIKELFNKKLSKVDITIRNLYPPRSNGLIGNIKSIGPYGWEESEFPKEYVELFNARLSHLFCMSIFVRDVMINNGVITPLCVSGLGVEHILKSTSKNFIKLPSGFRLLHISSAFPRKGIDLLLKAFDELNFLDISLIIKTFPNPHNNICEQIESFGFIIYQSIEENIIRYKKDKLEILLINKELLQGEINYLYGNSNLLVAPSRGEGFGLPVAEAMLFNLPVLTTNYGGVVDFCNEKRAFLIDFEFQKAKSHFNLSNSVWVEPKIDNLKEQIVKIYNLSKDDISKKTKNAKEFIENNFNWKKVTSKIISFTNQKQVTKTKNIAIVSTFNTKCGIAKYSSYLISSFKDRIKIFANYSNDIIETHLEDKIIRCWKMGEENNSENFSNLKEKIEKNSITSLIIQYNFSFFSLKLLSNLINYCNLKNISTYIFIHSAKDVHYSHKINSFSLIDKSLKKAKRIMVHSIEDMNILKNFNIYKNTMFFPHGIDNSLLNKKSTSFFPIFFDKSIPTVATFGFLLPHKGLLELIKAVEIINQKTPIQLLLLNSLYPSPISENEKNKIEDYINNSNYKNFIQMNNEFLKDEDVVETLSKADVIIYPYQNTQEASSAAVRLGLLSQKPIITTPLLIFDDVKEIVYQSSGISPKQISTMIEIILSNPHKKLNLQKKWIDENSWSKISKRVENILSCG